MTVITESLGFSAYFSSCLSILIAWHTCPYPQPLFAQHPKIYTLKFSLGFRSSKNWLVLPFQPCFPLNTSARAEQLQSLHCQELAIVHSKSYNITPSLLFFSPGNWPGVPNHREQWKLCENARIVMMCSNLESLQYYEIRIQESKTIRINKSFLQAKFL